MSLTTPHLCRELLPARKSSIRGAGLTWDLTTRLLTLETDRKSDRRYAVTELRIDASYRGRAFTLAKRAAGTDAEADGYTLFVAAAGPGRDSCECRGFLRHGNCSHLDGVRAAIANGWMDAAEERPAAAPVTEAEVEAMAAGR